jgi:hypothetical protein
VLRWPDPNKRHPTNVQQTSNKRDPNKRDPNKRDPNKRPNKRYQQTWKALINETLDIEVLAKVRHCANTGLVLGTESFREQVRRLRN